MHYRKRPPIRHGDRPGPVHRMRRLHGGLRGGEQRASRPRAHDCAHRHHADAGASGHGAAGNGAAAFIPVLCMQCGHETPCVSVCPQQAVEVDRGDGNRDPDAAALPGLPLLHDRLPVSRPLFQLVGPGVARRAWRRR